MISLHLRCSEVFCSNSVCKILAGLLLNKLNKLFQLAVL